MKMSRIVAAVLVIAAVIWIGSGVVGRAERESPKTTPGQAQNAAKATRFKVSVVPVKLEQHAPGLILSGRTEADKRASAVARASGIIVDLRVRRGSVVKKGDVIAVLSDEARTAQLDQAKARLEQRKIELRARLRLIEQGNYPAINKPQLEAELSAAEAGVAQAKAEAEKSLVLAPISGVVNSVPVETGQALQPAVMVAEVVALDPMLAVIEVTERQLGGVRVGDKASVRLVTGEGAEGVVRFISRTASAQTRTYRVDVEIPNPRGTIPDGVTATVVLRLAPTEAARVPRSALTFSADGRLAVRTVLADGRVADVSVTIVEDAIDQVWLVGLSNGASVIVQGQDFVKDGETVDPQPAPGA
jgi:multidrug efflux system membrane fusion protein